MSSDLGTQFGAQHGDDYRKVLIKWAKRLKGTEEASDKARAEWRVDLHKALGDEVAQALQADPKWKKLSASFADKDTLDRFAKIAAKGALTVDTDDLLNRLVRITNTPNPSEAKTRKFGSQLQSLAEEQEIGPDGQPVPVKDPGSVLRPLGPLGPAIGVGGALGVLLLSKRVYQTVSQIFDMAKDRLGRLVGLLLFRKKKASGRRMWRTSSLKSRHKDLNEQIKEKDESFVYKGQAIYGPRPPGGSPDHWSNCSCYLVYETAGGDWE